MEVVSLIVEPVVNLLAVHITKKLGYLTSSTEHVKRMKNKMADLEDQRAEIEEQVREYDVSNYKKPVHVQRWLEEFQKIKEEVDNISSIDIGCLNVKKKYLAGRNALRVTKDVECLIKKSSDIPWRKAHIGFGRVNSKIPASTSGGNTQNVFDSRVKPFNDALKLLQEDDDGKTQVIALCGMGGVGKTTLMKQLKEVAKNEKMFDWIVDVVIGNAPNLLNIQKAIAVQTGEPLTETDETLMATYLSNRFKEFVERKEKILVLLDDVWKKIKLEDIGLASPLPNGVKLLLTSRDVKVCLQISVDADSRFKDVRVDVLEEGEARDFFSRIAGVTKEDDHDLYQIGCDIVKKCGGLPLAIKLIAAALKCEKKPVWKHTLKCLMKDNEVQNIVDMSYKNLEQEDKEIFLLCGLFPEDSNIPIEDLTRYAWGLKLLEQVSTIEDARESTETSVSNLKNKNLLMDGDSRHSDCVKMHDLVLSFAVATVSKGGEDGCRIIHHEDAFSNWSKANSMSESCKQISLTCKVMPKFPSDLRFPNLSLLKLMHGDESLMDLQAFYATMENLQVIAFERMEYPLVPTSFQCSTNLRTLCLHKCSLTFDLACIGNLSNLEVLSFANSGITTIPSTFGNLKKLRLLDVTGCCNLVIDDGVLKSFVKLEELYMIPYYKKKACCFTDNNSREFAERSENLKRFKLSLRFSFTEVREHVQMYKVDMHSYENSLMMVSNTKEILKSKINQLFKITDALYLQVNDMNSLKDVEIPHPPQNSSFCNLRLLVVSECTELKYLFTPSVAKFLSKLEYLDISGCPNMEAVIHTENNRSDIIIFSNLMYLRLAELPNLLCFCSKFQLPRLVKLQLEGLQNFTSIYPSNASSSVSSNISRVQSFFHKEDAAPNLEKLVVSDMENLKEIWPPQFSISNLCPLIELTVVGCGSIEVLFNMDFGENQQLGSSLRSITVERCDSLVKLFSCNPFPFLNNLQELYVESCGSIEVIFDIDMGCVGEMDKVSRSGSRSIKVKRCDSLVKLFSCNPFPCCNNSQELEVRTCGSSEVIFDNDMGCAGEMDKVSSSRLRSIDLRKLGKLREVWRIKDAGNNLIHGFEAVESIHIQDCERFENLITPATTTFDMRALKQVEIIKCGRESRREISKIAFPSSLLPTFNHLDYLHLWRSYEDVEVVFEITSPISRESPHNTQQQLIILPNLEELVLCDLKKMSHVWKCNWNELILQKQPSQSSFHNLTTIWIENCNSIKYLFSPLMVKLLSSLKEIYIRGCDAIEEVVSNRDDEDASINSHTTASVGVVFPQLKSLELRNLPNFVGFFLGKNEFIWPTLEKVLILYCPQITVSGPITKLRSGYGL